MPGSGQPDLVPANNGDTPKSDANQTSDKEQKEEPINFLLFSEKAANSELMGLSHWMFYSDGSNVYSYGIVHGLGAAQTVLEGLENVNSMVVD